MRDLDSAIVTALAAKTFKRRTFFSITARDFSTGASVSAYFWNDVGPITCNVIDGLTGGIVSRTFAGSGTLLTCGSIVLSSDLAPRTVTLTLNQTDDRIDNYIRGYDLKNAYCEIHRGLFNPLTHVIVAQPIPIFVGFGDSMHVVSPAADSAGSIELNLVSHTRELTRAGSASRSFVDQQTRDGSDTFLKYAGVMKSTQLFWGTAKAAQASTVSPSSAAAGNASSSLSRFK